MSEGGVSEVFNASAYLLDRRIAAGDGERLAVTGPAGDLSYADLLALTQRTAAALTGLGVRAEERVLLLMADGPAMLAAILGAMRMGAVPVPVSTMLGAKDVAVLVRDSRARVVIVSDPFVDIIAGGETAAALDDAPDLAAVVVDGERGVSAAVPTHRLADLLGAAPAGGGCYATVADSPAFWLYTSGTTGTPKAAMHRHGAVEVVCETYGRQVLGITRDDRCLSVAKLFFAYGIGNSCFFPLSVGATVVLEPDRPTPALIAARLTEYAPTIFYAVPTFFAAMLKADVPPAALASVRIATSAGEPLPAALLTRFTTRFGVDILDGIGMTEALHIFLSNRAGAIRPGSTGVAVPGYDLRIVDDSGADVPDDTPGTLLVRGDSVATGYYSRYDASRAVFLGDWLRTGDTYLRSVDGYYTCLGRSNDMLKAGGIWVSPAEVEARLLEHPGVDQVAVVAVADPEGLDKPVACVIRTAEATATAEELIEFCRAGLPSFKRPRAVVFMAEFPTTATGKLRRFAIRAAAAEALR